MNESTVHLEGSEIVVRRRGEEVRLPAGADPLARMPYVGRSLLEAELAGSADQAPALKVFDEIAAALGCSGVGVRPK